MEQQIVVTSPSRGRSDIVRPARLQGFSDAVFATAATLLVIPIRKFEVVAGEKLENTLLHRWPELLVFVFGFLIICSVWESHIIRFRVVSKVDDVVVFFTLLSLMVTTFLPFTVELQGYYGSYGISIVLNCFMLLALEVIELIIFMYAFYNPKLLSERFTRLEPEVMKIKKRQIYFKAGINSILFILAAIFSLASFILSWILIVTVVITPLLRRVMVKLTYFCSAVTNLPSAFEVLSGRISKERIEVFSDAATAIVATLLILDLTTEDFPSKDQVEKYGLGKVLQHMWQMFVSYIGTFSTVGFLWFVHHSLLQHIKIFTPLMVIFNNIFLTFLAGSPFISTLVNKYTGTISHNERIAVQVSSFILFAASFMHIAILVCSMYQRHNTLQIWSIPENEERHTRSSHLYLLLKTLIIPFFTLFVFLMSFISDKAAYYSYHIALYIAPVCFVVLKIVFACHCCHQREEHDDSHSISVHSSLSNLSVDENLVEEDSAVQVQLRNTNTELADPDS